MKTKGILDSKHFKVLVTYFFFVIKNVEQRYLLLLLSASHKSSYAAHIGYST